VAGGATVVVTVGGVRRGGIAVVTPGGAVVVTAGGVVVVAAGGVVTVVVATVFGGTYVVGGTVVVAVGGIVVGSVNPEGKPGIWMTVVPGCWGAAAGAGSGSGRVAK
jgi:hypothetical protein